MSDRPTSFDIAQAAGVSQPTVSRALRGSPLVSAATRQRVEAAAQRLHYSVDRHASRLRTHTSNTLALLFFEDPSLDESLINPFFLSMLGSITRSAAARGYDLLVSFQQLSADWHVDFHDSRKADGIILLGYGDYQVYRARLDQLVAQGTHFVRWGQVAPGQPGCTIGCDNVAGGALAARHLIARGRRRLAFLGTADDHYPEFLDRFTGAAGALADAGLAPPVQVDAIASEAAGHAAATELLVRGADFDAIFAASDLIALGAMRALAEAGRSVPHDVAVVGFDDLPAAQLATPGLTTVAQNFTRAGGALVDALIGRIKAAPVGSQVLPAELVVRQSCGVAG